MNNKKHFKQQAEFFDKEFSIVSKYSIAEWQKSYVEKFKKYLLGKNFKGKTLLDIGTGTGYTAIELARYGVKVIACDLSPQAINNLNKYKKKHSLKNLSTLVCNAEQLPLKDSSVDFIVANAVLEHLPNEDGTMNEWKRVLKKNGRMFITVPLSLKLIYPFLWLINILYDRRLGHLRRYHKESLEKKFKLKTVNVFYTGHLLKVIGAIFSVILKTHSFDAYLEEQDRKKQDIAYGANNISIILQK